MWRRLRTNPYFTNDVGQAYDAVTAWCQLADSTNIERNRDILLDRIEDYVKTSLSTQRVWAAVDKLARIIMSPEQSSFAQVANSMVIPKPRIARRDLEF
jgi:hypothetical protein